MNRAKRANDVAQGSTNAAGTLELPEFRRQNLVQMVFDALKENILSARLAEGECLPSIDGLARQLNVSRTVIREALHKLSSLGFVRSEQGRGTFVCKPSAGDVMEPMLQLLRLEALPAQQLLETRYHLERIIARLAARRARVEDAHLLHGHLEAMEGAIERQDLELLSQEDVKFHLALADISGNQLLGRILETIREMTFKFMYAIAHLESVRVQALESHRRIAAAVAQNDGTMAEREMGQHILNMVEAIRTKYQVDVTVE